MSIRAKLFPPRYYIHFMWGCVEPQLHGPYGDYDIMIAEAKRIWANEGGEEHAISYIKVDEYRALTTGSFTNLKMKMRSASAAK